MGLNSFGAQHVSGLVVEELSSDSAAAKAGIHLGDRVIRYDGKLLPSPAAFDALQENTFGRKDVVLQIRRSEATLSLTVPLGSLGLKVRPELPPDAEKLYEEGKASLKAGDVKAAIAHWEASARSQENDKVASAWLYERAGEVLESQRQWKEAGEAHSAAWELLKQTGKIAAQSKTLLALGRCDQARSDFDAAVKWYEQALSLDLAAGNEMWAADDLHSLGNAAGIRGDLVAAENYSSRALATRERLAPNSLAVSRSLNSLGNIAQIGGDLAAAQDYQSRALAIRERLAPGSLTVGHSLNNLGNIAQDRGDLDAAQDFRIRALAILQRLAPDSLDVAATLSNLGAVAEVRGDLAAAQDYETRALTIGERLGPHSLPVAHCLNNLGNIAQDRGDLAAAQDYQSRALAIQERLAPNSLDVAASLDYLGAVAQDRGDWAARRNSIAAPWPLASGSPPTRSKSPIASISWAKLLLPSATFKRRTITIVGQWPSKGELRRIP